MSGVTDELDITDRSDITAKLRNEINIGKQHRHEYVMRKFSTTSVLLGAGSIKTQFGGNAGSVDFTLLLFLVPLVALAFDMYIFAEDYRIRRAGGFIRNQRGIAVEGEGDWEDFCKANRNELASIPSGFVTLILLIIASFLLFGAGYAQILWYWIAFNLTIFILISVMGGRVKRQLDVG